MVPTKMGFIHDLSMIYLKNKYDTVQIPCTRPQSALGESSPTA